MGPHRASEMGRIRLILDRTNPNRAAADRYARKILSIDLPLASSVDAVNVYIIPTDGIQVPESEAVQPIQDMVAEALADIGHPEALGREQRAVE